MTPDFLDSNDPEIYTLRTHAPGPVGRLPVTPAMLRAASSGEIFGLTQNAGMGWDPRKLLGREFLILSTQGGIRAPDGTPVALGYHTGHWEVGLLMEEAAGLTSTVTFLTGNLAPEGALVKSTSISRHSSMRMAFTCMKDRRGSSARRTRLYPRSSPPDRMRSSLATCWCWPASARPSGCRKPTRLPPR